MREIHLFMAVVGVVIAVFLSRWSVGHFFPLWTPVLSPYIDVLMPYLTTRTRERVEAASRPKTLEPRVHPNTTWPTYSRLKCSGRLISVPDVHGDYVGLVKILRKSGLVASESTDWIGNDSILVQTGDVLDRGDDSSEALRLLAKLSIQARAQGGHVIPLMGNHELMNLMNFFMYATPGEDRGFLPQTRSSAFDPHNGEFGKFVRSFPGAVVVEIDPDHKVLKREAGVTPSDIQDLQSREDVETRSKGKPANVDASVLFVHAGLSPEFLSTTPSNPDSLSVLNSRLRAYFSLDARELKAHYMTPLLSDNGPLWSRFFAMSRDEGKVCSRLQETLELVRAAKMVVGHTVQVRSSVGMRCGGRLVLSDIGFAPYYYGHPLALEHFSNGSHAVIEDKMV